MPGNIISTSIVWLLLDIISHFPFCITPHTSYLFNLRRPRPVGVRPNPGAVWEDRVGWDGDDEKSGVGSHCVSLSLSLSFSLQCGSSPSHTTTSLPGHRATDWAQWEGPLHSVPATCVLVVVLGHLTSLAKLSQHYNWIVEARPIKIPPLMQDTLQQALMCIEVLAVAWNIIMLLLWAVGHYIWSHVCSVVLVIKIRFTQ